MGLDLGSESGKNRFSTGFVFILFALGWIDLAEHLIAPQLTSAGNAWSNSIAVGIGLVIALIMGVAITAGKRRADKISVFLVVVVVCLPGFWLLFRAFGILRGFGPDILAWLPGHSFRVIGMILVVLAGAVLFWVRLKFRMLFGLTEVAFACYVAWDKIPCVDIASSTGNSALAVNASTIAVGLISGSIYLLVRGFDNMHQGYIHNKTAIKSFLKLDPGIE